jgi:hypothetical protein
MKSHEWNFSYEVEMVQLTCIHYMIKYFIKFNNHLNHLWNINFHFVVYCYKYYILKKKIIQY